MHNPETTPLLIKRLILITVLMALFSSLGEVFVNNAFDLPGPMTYLTLNTAMFLKGYLFQIFTYPLTYGTVGESISVFTLITLMVNLYFLWIMGSHIIERMGTKDFVKLYLFATVFAGLIGVALAYLFGYNVIFSGFVPQVLAILVAWNMLNGNGRLFILPPFSIKAKWLTLTVLLFCVIPPLSSFQLPLAGFYLAGAMAGWLFALFSWHLTSPWKSIAELENRVIIWIAKTKLFFKRKSSKIIDIRSIPKEDDLFMDEMLEKISQYGEGSLTPLERKRMQKISRKNK